MKKILVTIPLGIWVSWASAAEGIGQGIPPAGNSGASATNGFTANQPGTAGANRLNQGVDPRYPTPGQIVPPVDTPASQSTARDPRYSQSTSSQNTGGYGDPAAYRANTNPNMVNTSSGTNTGTIDGIPTVPSVNTYTSTGTSTGTNRNRSTNTNTQP